MSTYHFKTNISSAENINTLKSHLDAMEAKKEIKKWSVDVNDPEKLLVIETDKLSPEEAKHLIREAGFDAEFTKAPQARTE